MFIKFRLLSKIANELKVIIYNKSDKILIATFSRFCWEFLGKNIKDETFYRVVSGIRICNVNKITYTNKDKINSSKFINLLSVDNDKNEIILPRKAFELLFLLASKPERVFKREEIMNHVWGTQVVVGDRTIDVHIRKLREKIGDLYFKTVKGVGYKFDKF